MLPSSRGQLALVRVRRPAAVQCRLSYYGQYGVPTPLLLLREYEYRLAYRIMSWSRPHEPVESALAQPSNSIIRVAWSAADQPLGN